MKRRRRFWVDQAHIPEDVKRVVEVHDRDFTAYVEVYSWETQEEAEVDVPYIVSVARDLLRQANSLSNLN